MNENILDNTPIRVSIPMKYDPKINSPVNKIYIPHNSELIVDDLIPIPDEFQNRLLGEIQ